MEPNYKYVIYATSDNGNGYVQEIGRYDDVDEIEIRVGMFNKDVRITIEKQDEED
jgi:hypothetical protein